MWQLIHNTQQQREQLFTSLYQQVFPGLARWVAKRGGSFEQAKDVFQDALVIYYEKQLSNGVAINNNEKAYLMGIAKHLWFKTYNAGAGMLPIDDVNINLQQQDDDESYATDRLMNYLQTAGQKCMDMLRAFYYDKLPLTQITEQFGYSGVRSVTVQKYKCLEKIRETVKQNSLQYEDFLE